MFKNIKMLLELRAWLKSRTLNIAGLLGLIAAIDLTTPSDILQWLIDFAMTQFGWSTGTIVAIITLLKAIADALLRAKTDTPLDQK